MWPWGACWLQEGWQTADLDAQKKPLMCGRPWGEAIDVWPWGACWLQEGWQTADLDAHKKPLMCGVGVAVGCRMKHAKSTF